MRMDFVVQHDDRTPTGSRFASFYIHGIPWSGRFVHGHEVVAKGTDFPLQPFWRSLQYYRLNPLHCSFWISFCR